MRDRPSNVFWNVELDLKRKGFTPKIIYVFVPMEFLRQLLKTWMAWKETFTWNVKFKVSWNSTLGANSFSSRLLDRWKHFIIWTFSPFYDHLSKKCKKPQHKNYPNITYLWPTHPLSCRSEFYVFLMNKITAVSLWVLLRSLGFKTCADVYLSGIHDNGF